MASKNVSSPPNNKRPKKPKCTDAENTVLLEEIALEKTLLTSYFQNGVILMKKELMRQKIADKVNAVGGHGRKVAQIKKRWKDYCDMTHSVVTYTMQCYSK